MKVKHAYTCSILHFSRFVMNSRKSAILDEFLYIQSRIGYIFYFENENDILLFVNFLLNSFICEK